MSLRLLQSILIFVVAIASNIETNAVTAESILTAATDKFMGSQSLSASFSIKSTSGETLNGSITMSGNMFVISTPQLKTWFDGQTQWSYSTEIQEVNITEPTIDELQQINPFAIIANFRNSYNCKLLESSQGTYKIQLIPKTSQQTIKKAILTINSTTFYPTEISLTSDNTITITVTNVKASNTMPKSAFQFNEKNYPGVEIIDLR